MQNSLPKPSNDHHVSFSPSINWAKLGKAVHDVAPIINVFNAQPESFWSQPPQPTLTNNNTIPYNNNNNATKMVNPPEFENSTPNQHNIDVSLSNINLNVDKINSNNNNTHKQTPSISSKYNNTNNINSNNNNVGHVNHKTGYSFTDLKQLKLFIDKPATAKSVNSYKYDNVISALNEIKSFFDNELFISDDNKDNDISRNFHKKALSNPSINFSVTAFNPDNNTININHDNNNKSLNLKLRKTASLVQLSKLDTNNVSPNKLLRAKSYDIPNHTGKDIDGYYTSDASVDTADDIEYMQTYDRGALTKISELQQINSSSPITVTHTRITNPLREMTKIPEEITYYIKTDHDTMHTQTTNIITCNDINDDDDDSLNEHLNTNIEMIDGEGTLSNNTNTNSNNDSSSHPKKIIIHEMEGNIKSIKNKNKKNCCIKTRIGILLLFFIAVIISFVAGFITHLTLKLYC